MRPIHGFSPTVTLPKALQLRAIRGLPWIDDRLRPRASLGISKYLNQINCSDSTPVPEMDRAALRPPDPLRSCAFRLPSSPDGAGKRGFRVDRPRTSYSQGLPAVLVEPLRRGPLRRRLTLGIFRHGLAARLLLLPQWRHRRGLRHRRGGAFGRHRRGCRRVASSSRRPRPTEARRWSSDMRGFSGCCRPRSPRCADLVLRRHRQFVDPRHARRADGGRSACGGMNGFSSAGCCAASAAACSRLLDEQRRLRRHRPDRDVLDRSDLRGGECASASRCVDLLAAGEADSA